MGKMIQPNMPVSGKPIDDEKKFATWIAGMIGQFEKGFHKGDNPPASTDILWIDTKDGV